MTKKLKNLIEEERPRERLIKYGAENISTEDLISIILKTGTKEMSVKDLSIRVLSEIDNIGDLQNLTLSKLKNIKGIGTVKALELISAIELGKRVYQYNNKPSKKIKTSLDTFNVMKNKFINKVKEHFFVIYLDTKSNILDIKLLFIGNVNSCIIDIGEIFKHAYLLSATSFICVHNHPSGDVKPSKNDDINTVKIIKTGKLQNILLKDHIIIGNNKYYSYYENSNFIF